MKSTALFLAIDPGNDTGIAILDADGFLWDVCVSNVDTFFVGSQVFKTVLIEKPKVYPSRNSKGDPNDLIKLAIDVGRYKQMALSAGARVELVEPRTWKGTISKEIHHPRVWGALAPVEQALVADRMKGIAVSKRHNAMDAVGLAKWGFSNGFFRT